MEKLKQAQTLYANKYEEKVKATILKFADSVKTSNVYINMKRILEILIKLREEEATLEPILNKWVPRGKELELMCSSHVDAEENDNLRSTCEFIKEMNILSVEGVGIKRKSQIYRKEYANHKFEMFSGGFIGHVQLNEEKTWLKEVDHNLSLRINQIISTEDTSLFVQIIEEIEKVKSHYGFIEIEIGHVRATWK